MASLTRLLKILAVTLALTIFSFSLAACHEGKNQGSIIVGCSNNVGGMLVNFALTNNKSFTVKTTTDEMSTYPMMDCCSSNSTWSLTSGELDAAVLCPDAAENFLAANKDFILAGPLTYDTEVLVVANPRLKTIGYSNGQERQKENLIAVYGDDPEYVPIIATSLPYALSTGQIDAAVLDIGTAIWLDYTLVPLKGEEPTTVLVVQKDFYASATYENMLEAIENARVALNNFEAFQEAMRFLSTEEVGRKEYEKWLSLGIRFPGQLKHPNRTTLNEKD